MTKKTKIIIAVVALVILAASAAYYWGIYLPEKKKLKEAEEKPAPAPTQEPANQVTEPAGTTNSQ